MLIFLASVWFQAENHRLPLFPQSLVKAFGQNVSLEKTCECVWNCSRWLFYFGWPACQRKSLSSRARASAISGWQNICAVFQPNPFYCRNKPRSASFGIKMAEFVTPRTQCTRHKKDTRLKTGDNKFVHPCLNIWSDVCRARRNLPRK